MVNCNKMFSFFLAFWFCREFFISASLAPLRTPPAQHPAPQLPLRQPLAPVKPSRLPSDPAAPLQPSSSPQTPLGPPPHLPSDARRPPQALWLPSEPHGTRQAPQLLSDNPRPPSDSPGPTQAPPGSPHTSPAPLKPSGSPPPQLHSDPPARLRQVGGLRGRGVAEATGVSPGASRH